MSGRISIGPHSLSTCQLEYFADQATAMLRVLYARIFSNRGDAETLLAEGATETDFVFDLMDTPAESPLRNLMLGGPHAARPAPNGTAAPFPFDGPHALPIHSSPTRAYAPL